MYEQTDNEILESWDRYEEMKEKWQQEDLQVTPTGDVLFVDEPGWVEAIPRVAQLASNLVSQLEAQLAEPVLSRFQAMEQNIRLQLAVHNHIPKSDYLQNEIGNGPLPFVQYAKALRTLRNLAQARQRDSAAPAQWDAVAAFHSLPETEVNIQALLDGQMDTPEDAALWSEASAFDILGNVPAFAGPVEQQALRELKLSHLEPDSVDDWIFQSTRIHILLSVFAQPFRALHEEFRTAQPETIRSTEELVAEAKAIRKSITEQGEILYTDAKASEIRKAFQASRFHQGRLRTRDVISFRGVILSPYEEYLTLHWTIRHAELVRGLAFPSDFAPFPFLSPDDADPLVSYHVDGLAERTGDISPLPIPNTPQTSFSLYCDFMRLKAVKEKLRIEAVNIAARHGDTNWLLQNEESRVERLQEVRNARKTSPAYAKLFGEEAAQQAITYHPPPDAVLDPVPAPLLVQSQIFGGVNTPHRVIDHVLVDNVTPPQHIEGIDHVLEERETLKKRVAQIKETLDSADSSNQDYETYELFHNSARTLREVQRTLQMHKLRMEYPRREMLETISSQVSNLDTRLFH